MLNPASDKPFELFDAQHAFFQHAWRLTDDGHLVFPDQVLGFIKKTGKTATAAMHLPRPSDRGCPLTGFETARAQVQNVNMPRTRLPPDKPYPTASGLAQGVEQQQKKRGGRPKGVRNRHGYVAREAILISLNEAGGRDGIIGLVKKLIRKNLDNAIPLLQLVTPRAVEAAIQHQVTQYASTGDIDKDLAAAGLPPMREIFQVEYKREDDAPEAAHAE